MNNLINKMCTYIMHYYLDHTLGPPMVIPTLGYQWYGDNIWDLFHIWFESF